MTTAIRILLVEDHVEARQTLADLLAAFGHEVVAAVGTVRDSIATAASVAPDVVLLDVHMPDGSGLDAATAIVRARPETAIVLFSGDQEVDLSPEQATSTGAVAFLAKPVPPKMLDATLRMAVSRARELARARGGETTARTELENRKTIERAKGILMRRTGASEQEAYRILQRTSQDRSQPMVDIARTVIASEPK